MLPVTRSVTIPYVVAIYGVVVVVTYDLLLVRFYVADLLLRYITDLHDLRSGLRLFPFVDSVLHYPLVIVTIGGR